jgi:hypothetical protein
VVRSKIARGDRMTSRMLLAAMAHLLLAGAAPVMAADAPPADLPPCPSREDAPDTARLLRRVEFSLEGASSIGTLTMKIRTPAWSRALRMRVWSRGKDFALVRILEGGPRETGMMTLKRERQLWNYLPQAGRVMKLPSGMLGDSWMGSDFTNDDLVRGTSLARDFDAKLLGTLDQAGRAAWRVELVPRASATVVWGRIELVLDRESCVPLVERFFDEDGALARTMTFGDLRAIGWRRFPARMTVRPAEGDRETEISYGDMAFDVDVPEETFSLHRLQQGR